MLAMMPKEDRLTVLGSMTSKGDQAARLLGTQLEAVTSGTVELNREEFSKLQEPALEQRP